MLKRFFVLLAACFLLVPMFAAHADILVDEEIVVFQDEAVSEALSISTPLLISISAALAMLVVFTILYIRVNWEKK